MVRYVLTTILAILTAADSCGASVTVRKTGRGPTGFEVDFVFRYPNASNVVISGGLKPFTDQFHMTPQKSAKYDPQYYRPGDFFVSLPTDPDQYADWPYVMTRQDNTSTSSSSSSSSDDEWTYTAPFPSGTYNYAFLVDCPVANCTATDPRYVIDPDNPPFENVAGDQIASTFQVPFDAQFQLGSAVGPLNFDYALPITSSPFSSSSNASAAAGTVQAVNYTSPGSTHPAPDEHDFVIYLPAGYDASREGDEAYPVLYLSHGGGGSSSDWENLARASHILDNLILAGHIEPTVVVMPNFYDLGGTSGNSSSAVADNWEVVVRENYMEYLFPWVESHYSISRSPSRRAFAGLSLGSLLTYEMYLNATTYFTYFGLFSGARGPSSPASAYLDASALAADPDLATRGVYLDFGLYDIAFEDCRALQAALDGVGIPCLARVAPWGSHYWNTWQDALWNFGVTSLWKTVPFGSSSARG